MGGGRERAKESFHSSLPVPFVLLFSLVSKFTPPSNVCRTHRTGYAPHTLLKFILTRLPRQE